MARRVIDLSQPLSRESQLHPFFSPTQILRHILHSDARRGPPSFNAELIITSNHAATHVDAFGHYRRRRAIGEMPLDPFCGEAICVDIREYPRGHDVSAAEVEPPSRPSRTGAAAWRHPPLLQRPLQPHGRHPRIPRWLLRHLRGGGSLDGRPRGEDLRRRDDQPDLVYLTDRYPTHRACAERGSPTTRTSTTSWTWSTSASSSSASRSGWCRPGSPVRRSPSSTTSRPTPRTPRRPQIGGELGRPRPPRPRRPPPAAHAEAEGGGRHVDGRHDAAAAVAHRRRRGHQAGLELLAHDRVAELARGGDPLRAPRRGRARGARRAPGRTPARAPPRCSRAGSACPPPRARGSRWAATPRGASARSPPAVPRGGRSRRGRGRGRAGGAAPPPSRRGSPARSASANTCQPMRYASVSGSRSTRPLSASVASVREVWLLSLPTSSARRTTPRPPRSRPRRRRAPAARRGPVPGRTSGFTVHNTQDETGVVLSADVHDSHAPVRAALTG